MSTSFNRYEMLARSVICTHKHTHIHKIQRMQQPTYLHGQCSCLLVVVVQQVGHEGGVVRQILAHSQSDGFAAELTVALHGLHVNGTRRRHHEEQQEDWDEVQRELSWVSFLAVFYTSCSAWCSHLHVIHFSTTAQITQIHIT